MPIEANEKAYINLYKKRGKIELVFNYSLGLNGKDRYAHIPAFCEMLKIPYTGSSPLTNALAMNKAMAKSILLANNIPTLPYQLFKDDYVVLSEKLNFPLIVKPIGQGSSAGITNESVVNDTDHLRNRIEFIINLFKEPALVEPFLTGREFSVAMLGNPPIILPIIESDHTKLPSNYLPLDSLEVKWFFEEESSDNNVICPAKIEKDLEDKISVICREVWEALNIHDLCRIDLRCDNSGNPYVLDINSPPGLIPPEISKTSYFPLSGRVAGIDYENLIRRVINAALSRIGIKSGVKKS